MNNIIDLLDKHGINYKRSGRNIGRNFISIQCPSCFDDRGHFGINVNQPFCKCFVCGFSTNVSRLISKLLKISYRKANKLVAQYYDLDIIEYDEEIEPNENEESFLKVFNSFGDLEEIHKEYLRNRNFDPDYLVQHYNLKASSSYDNKWKYRVVIPIVMNKRICSFVARDVTEKQSIRYRYCDDEIALTKRKDLIFDNTNGEKYVILVEGIFDSLRLGSPSIALLSTQFTKSQISNIIKRDYERVVIIFDSDESGRQKSEDLANTLSMSCGKIEVVDLGNNSDPADLSEDEVRYLKKEIRI